MPYFNYRIQAVDATTAGRSGRRGFLHTWWSLYRDDDRWAPPDYAQLLRDLDPRHTKHLSRLEASFVHVDALRRTGVRSARNDQQEIPLVSLLERPLAATVVLIDRRRADHTASLALLKLGNDGQAIEKLIDYLVDDLPRRGIERIIGPTGLSPCLGSGLLVDGWDEWPPFQTPSNPPYVPELLERHMRPAQSGRLFHAAIPAELVTTTPGPANLKPFDPVRLAGDLLPLFIGAAENRIADLPLPDATEVAFMLRQLERSAVAGYLAEMDGSPVGFVLLGADTAARLRLAHGGRPLWGRALLKLVTRSYGKSRVSNGRIHFCAVLPEWRGRGIGRQLWQNALAHGRDCGWKSLSAGPIWLPLQGALPASAFLESMGASAGQTYRLYERKL